MSNIGSTALQTSKQHTQTHPNVPSPTKKQQGFNQGTMNLLDEARGVVENAVGQGQQLNPLIYQMLGLQPQYEDNSQDLQAAQGEMDAAQKQWTEAQQTVAQISGIPKGKRSPAQKKQLKQLNKQMPALTQAQAKTHDAFAALQTSAKSITGFQRMDAGAIPKESPFSSQNPLNQAQATESQRLNQYLAGGEVDPTLKHQYDSAEASLRAKLAQRFGPDFESSSVGQMALQNFSRQKNEAFATYNQQQVEKYNNLAFQGQAQLQNLLGGQIGLMQEPAQNQTNQGLQLGNMAQQRLAQQQIVQQWLLGRGGVSTNASVASPTGIAGGLGQLLTTPYNQQGNTLGGQAANGASAAYNGLSNWLGSGTSGAMAGSALGNAAAAGVGEGMSAEGVGAGMSAAGGGAIAGSDAAAALL